MPRVILRNTGRTAIGPDGTQRIYEAYNTTGLFAGATYELTESELTDAEWDAAVIAENVAKFAADEARNAYHYPVS